MNDSCKLIVNYKWINTWTFETDLLDDEAVTKFKTPLNLLLLAILLKSDGLSADTTFDRSDEFDAKTFVMPPLISCLP